MFLKHHEAGPGEIGGIIGEITDDNERHQRSEASLKHGFTN